MIAFPFVALWACFNCPDHIANCWGPVITHCSSMQATQEALRKLNYNPAPSWGTSRRRWLSGCRTLNGENITQQCRISTRTSCVTLDKTDTCGISFPDEDQAFHAVCAPGRPVSQWKLNEGCSDFPDGEIGTPNTIGPVDPLLPQYSTFPHSSCSAVVRSSEMECEDQDYAWGRCTRDLHYMSCKMCTAYEQETEFVLGHGFAGLYFGREGKEFDVERRIQVEAGASLACPNLVWFQPHMLELLSTHVDLATIVTLTCMVGLRLCCALAQALWRRYRGKDPGAWFETPTLRQEMLKLVWYAFCFAYLYGGILHHTLPHNEENFEHLTAIRYYLSGMITSSEFLRPAILGVIDSLIAITWTSEVAAAAEVTDIKERWRTWIKSRRERLTERLTLKNVCSPRFWCDTMRYYCLMIARIRLFGAPLIILFGVFSFGFHLGSSSPHTFSRSFFAIGSLSCAALTSLVYMLKKESKFVFYFFSKHRQALAPCVVAGPVVGALCGLLCMQLSTGIWMMVVMFPIFIPQMLVMMIAFAIPTMMFKLCTSAMGAKPDDISMVVCEKVGAVAVVTTMGIFTTCNTIYFNGFTGGFSILWHHMWIAFFNELNFDLKFPSAVSLPGMPPLFFGVPDMSWSTRNLIVAHDWTWMSFIVLPAVISAPAISIVRSLASFVKSATPHDELAQVMPSEATVIGAGAGVVGSETAGADVLRDIRDSSADAVQGLDIPNPVAPP